MKRKYSFPDKHWNWPCQTCFNHGVRADDMIFVGGQMDLDCKGRLEHKGDIWTQAERAMAHVETVLKDLSADIDDVVKLEVYYVSNKEIEESQIIEALRGYFRTQIPPALYIVPLPYLSIPGALISIEAIAMRSVAGTRMTKVASMPEGHYPTLFSHGLRCEEMIFLGTQMPLDDKGEVLYPGNPVEQARINMKNLNKVMQGFGANLEYIYNFNTRYVGAGTAEDWALAGSIRANIWKTKGKCGTGVPVTDLVYPGLTIRQDATGMQALNGEKHAPQAIFPAESWDWPIPVNVQQAVRIGKKVFIGGQISANEQGETVFPDIEGAQTANVMKFIRRCVEDAGGSIDDIVRCKAYYKSGKQPNLQALQQNLAISSAFFNKPGPAITAIPLNQLGLEDCTIEIEAVAILK